MKDMGYQWDNKWKARYWSCRQWRASAKVED
jgi:hypothetical protein